MEDDEGGATDSDVIESDDDGEHEPMEAPAPEAAGLPDALHSGPMPVEDVEDSQVVDFFGGSQVEVVEDSQVMQVEEDSQMVEMLVDPPTEPPTSDVVVPQEPAPSEPMPNDFEDKKRELEQVRARANMVRRGLLEIGLT